MADIRTAQFGSAYEAVTVDFLLTPAGDLDSTEELATAVRIALMTDALADQDDALPDPNSTDRRGWWGDLDAAEIWDGWPIGSKLWLLSREKITDASARQGSTTKRVEAYIREALEPLLARKVASRLDVSVTRAGGDRIDASVVLYRGPQAAVALRFDDLWRGIAASSPLA